MKNYLLFIVLLLVALIGGGLFFFKEIKSSPAKVTPTPTLTPPVMQLTPDQAPQVTLAFTSDAHYVTVNIKNIHAAEVEYNLIYDAVVKGNQINTGVNATAKLENKTEYSQKQLLGSESSGKFTYHTNIKNALMELTLRDVAGRSVYSATYPIEVKAGATVTLTPEQ